MPARKLRAAIAGEPSAYLRSIRSLLAEIPGVELSGTSKNCAELLELCHSNPVDVVLLELELASLDNYALLESVRSEYPALNVVVLAMEHERGAAVRALNRGAVDVLEKANEDGSAAALAEVLDRVMAGSRRQSQSHSPRLELKPESEPPAPSAFPSHDCETAFDLVLLACSTGGPNALREIVPQLPGDLPVPILAVQHLPKGYLPEMVEQLRAQSAIDVSISTNRMELPETGWIFARPGWHLEVRPNLLTGKGYYLRETTHERVHGCRPAADVLFHSVANAYEGRVLTVVLTGMGRDGCDGVSTLKKMGGYSIIQDEPTSVVYGMPRAVEEEGLADEIVPLGRIAERITKLVRSEES